MNQGQQPPLILAPSLSQATGEPLSNPMCHENNPACYFNASDQVQNDECPVCKKKGSFKFLTVLKEAQAQNPNRQIILQGKTAYYVQKTNYDESIYSQKMTIKNEQLKLMQFGSQNYSNIIHYLNNIYNQEMLETLLKAGNEFLKYTILAVLNGQLILFYHLYRMNIKLDIYLKLKAIASPLKDMQGKVIQIIEFQKKIYLLHQIGDKIQLYEGDLNSITTTPPKIIFISMQNFTFSSWALLIKCSETKLIVLGQEGTIIIYDQSLQQPNKLYDQVLKVESKNPPSLNDPFLFGNTNTHLVINNGKRVFFSSLLKYFKDCPKSYDTSFNSQPTLLLKINDQSFISFDHEKLLTQNAFFIELPNEQKTLPNIASVINHSNYANLERIPTTTYITGNISCILIGMKLNDFVVPGILVFNRSIKTFEIEMI